MKDPAFLFYPGDWLGGTITFSRLHKGAYMDVLMVQFNVGHMAIEDIQTVLGSDFEKVWPKLRTKFEIDANGLYFNDRLDQEIEKRRNYTESRKQNLNSNSKKTNHMATHMDKHMENEDENENINKDKDKKEAQKIQFPFSSVAFSNMWQNWKQYKQREFKFSYKSPQSEQAALIKLTDLAAGSEATAISIIRQSMENGWKGFFELKTNINGRNGNLQSDYKQSIANADRIIEQLARGK